MTSSRKNNSNSINIGQQRQRPPSRRRRHQKHDQQHDQQHQRLLLITAIILIASIFYWWNVIIISPANNEVGSKKKSHNYYLNDDEEQASRKKQWEKGLPLPSRSRSLSSPLKLNSKLKHAIAERDNTILSSRKNEFPKRQQRQSAQEVHPAPIDTIIRYLNKLAQLPPSQLWNVLGMDINNNNNANNNNQAHDGGDESDPFSLRELERGQCPWSTSSSTTTTTTTVDWLPSRPFQSESIAESYRNNMKALKNNNGKVRPRQQMERYDAENEVVIWYEHLSKAGGTTFCGLAQSNMLMWQVPRYHCMPRKGELMDGRVGSWPNEELIEHLTEERHAIVSNEWEPFSLEKLELSGRQLDGTIMKNNLHLGPRLLFLTVLRDPSDRLLSAYTFFALTTTAQEGKGAGGNTNAPSFSQWIDNCLRRAARYKMGSRNGFRANTARYNHITWRFSGGELTHLPPREESEWKPSFDTAIRALSQQDLILPMDVMTHDELGKLALQQLLGWNRFDAKGRFQGGDKLSGHVVTQGEVKNSNAREHFSEEQYRKLWDANWLDNILYLWSRAVFLARLHCKDVIVES